MGVLSFLTALVSTGGQIALGIIGNDQKTANAEAQLQQYQEQLAAEREKQKRQYIIICCLAVLIAILIAIYFTRIRKRLK